MINADILTAVLYFFTAGSVVLLVVLIYLWIKIYQESKELDVVRASLHQTISDVQKGRN